MESPDVLQVYDDFYERIFRYALSRVGDVEAARDITAEVFLKMYKSRWKFKSTGAPISAWLFRIAGNEISSYYRREKYRPLRLETEINNTYTVPLSLKGDLQKEIAEAQERVNQNAVYFEIHNQLLKLPEKYQEVILLHYLEEHTIPQIALMLGKKEGTVKSLISRGIAKLRRVAINRDRMTSDEEFAVPRKSQKRVNFS